MDVVISIGHIHPVYFGQCYHIMGQSAQILQDQLEGLQNKPEALPIEIPHFTFKDFYNKNRPCRSVYRFLKSRLFQLRCKPTPQNESLLDPEREKANLIFTFMQQHYGKKDNDILPRCYGLKEIQEAEQPIEYILLTMGDHLEFLKTLTKSDTHEQIKIKSRRFLPYPDKVQPIRSKLKVAV